MSQWKNIASVVAVSLATALAVPGCAAQGDEATDDPTVAGATDQAQAADEATGEAKEACGGGFGWGGFGGCGGFGWGGFGWGGFGWGGFGWGGCGCGGFGGWW